MAKIPYEVVEAFTRGESAQAGAFISHGDSLYTYGVKLAGKDEAGAIYLTAGMLKKYSRTSTRHQKAVRGVLPDETPFYSDWSGQTYGTMSTLTEPRMLPFTDRPDGTVGILCLWETMPDHEARMTALDRRR
jgi:hypothetical protein